ncbi:MAG: hypothetical protein ACYC8W_09540 [Candidatus Tyrphobacter sp.]
MRDYEVVPKTLVRTVLATRLPTIPARFFKASEQVPRTFPSGTPLARPLRHVSSASA